MLKVNLNSVVKVGKTVGKVGLKYIGPIAAGAMTVMSEIDAQKLRNTVAAQGNTIKELAEKVAKLEKR